MKNNKASIIPYNMAIIDDNNAEINMYGQVVSRVPKDWSTGERIAGYIGLDEFLEDLEDIKDKDNITVHINSGGGDLYAGLAIYNRLKKCKGHVTTVNDGLAGSAASLIFQAGDTRKMNAGSNLMAHGVSSFLFGYYNADDLDELSNQFKAHNQAVINVYAEAMGVSIEEAAELVQGETWLTGNEAVEKGLADEVIESSDPDVNNSLMRKIINKAGVVFKAQHQGLEQIQAIPEGVPQIANITGGTDKMEIKTVEELKNAFPELTAQIENVAKENAIKDGAQVERARIKGIEAIENTIADKNLIGEAKYGENPMTAEQLALKALQAQAAVGVNMLGALDDDASASGTADVTPVPNGGTEPELEDNVEAEAKIIGDIFKKMKGEK